MVQYIDYCSISFYINHLLTLILANMNFPWFKRIGIFFIPSTIAGWLILIAGLAFAVYSFIDIDSRSHSVSDTLMNFVFMCLIIGAVYSLIAFTTSRVKRK